MAYRNIYISKPTTLNIDNSSLRIMQEEADLRVPVEDILSIMIDDPSVVLNSYLISFLAQNDVLIFTCDRTHQPCAILSPFSFHSAQTKRVRQQLDLTSAFKKQTWKRIVQAKIENQARCLRLCGYDTKVLDRMASEVKSGDSDNREGAAARAYFMKLFGNEFTRDQDTLTNACLNYGYAILRGVIARSLVAHGFIPDLGVHHCSELNNFNLADDFIEPLRPCIDIVVAQDPMLRGSSELQSSTKKLLYDIINNNITIRNETHSISNSIELMVESYIASIRSRGVDFQLYPQLLSPARHTAT